MRWLPVACIVLGASCAWATTGSMYRGKCSHASARPASDGVGDYAATVQVSTDAPVCKEVYRP